MGKLLKEFKQEAKRIKRLIQAINMTIKYCESGFSLKKSLDLAADKYRLDDEDYDDLKEIFKNAR